MYYDHKKVEWLKERYPEGTRTVSYTHLYFPFLATVIIYIGFANIIGLLGFTPPTKDLNVTAGLAIMSIVLVEDVYKRQL